MTIEIKNEDIASAILAVPSGHMHLRLAITTKDGETIVLQEATRPLSRRLQS